ncbi:MAG: glycosyltransferase [Bacteroidia bacterium]|nr:glycosyltransferase [Bacteroidia bacterium]
MATIKKLVQSPKEITDSLLIEAAWEVCNQVGGIHTVIRSKVPRMVEKWGDKYCLLGPNVHPGVQAIFDPTTNYQDACGQVVLRMRKAGFDVSYGRWLISGRPKVVLFNLQSAEHLLNDIKFNLWEDHDIPTPNKDTLVDQVLVFGYMVQVFLLELAEVEKANPNKILVHLHEWMAATPVPALRKAPNQLRIVFTTHATLLGRYLAGNDPQFYEHLPFYDWLKESRHFGIETQVRIERAAAHGSHIFTTVSEVTGRECEFLLGRKPNLILPNGLNVERFTALHKFQNLHQEYKEKIQAFTMGHFFNSYSFDLEKTLFFFTSGRFEYKNKGFDLTLEALLRLNWKMQQARSEMKVVMFFITKSPYTSISPKVLESRGIMEEIRKTCDSIAEEVRLGLFQSSAASEDYKLPYMNDFVSDYFRLRLRRTLQTWKSKENPPVVTHDLKHPESDDILLFLNRVKLQNQKINPVKIIYHPDFISPMNPLFGMEYSDFVRGCHLGVFPSYYEPWGYTPLECVCSGVPSVTSDLSGFGDYVLDTLPDHNEKGIYVVNRKNQSFEDAAEELANVMMEFVQLSRRDRIQLRNRVESTSEHFDWKNLAEHYDMAYSLANA